MSLQTFLVFGILVCCCVVANGFRFRPRRWDVNVCETRQLINCTVLKWERYPCKESLLPEQPQNKTWGTASTYSFWNNKPHFPFRWCSRFVKKAMKCVLRRVHCCPGWKPNKRGRCKKPVSMEECNGGCENGGTCDTNTDQCLCPDGFTGKRCEEAVCRNDCKNGGVCVSTEGFPKCKCLSSFRGESCQEAVCHNTCLNGGSCLADGIRARCVCTDGFYGHSCQFEKRVGECPAPDFILSSTCSESQTCRHDGACPGQQKCCLSSRCGLKAICVERASDKCLFRGERYALKVTFQPNPCTVCTCLEPNATAAFGGAVCNHVPCPPPLPGFRRCKRQTTTDNRCCRVCAEPEIVKPADYQRPVFKNCPRDGMTLDLPKTGRSVDVPRTLVAVDMQKRKLEVTYSNKTVSWFRQLEKNFQLVIATAMDEWEEVVECPFIIRVRDRYPPEFTYCPNDIDAPMNRKVLWTVPRAVDNIGLEGPPEGDYRPGRVFPQGETLVTYTARDFEGNEELCQFIVDVYPTCEKTCLNGGVCQALASGAMCVCEEGFTGHDCGDVATGILDRVVGEDDDGNDDEEKERYYYIGAGIGVAILIILVALVLFVVCRRRRRTTRDKLPDTVGAPPSYSTATKSPYVLYPPAANTLAQVTVKSSDAYDNPVYVDQNQANHKSDA